MAKSPHVLDGMPRDWAIGWRVFGCERTDYMWDVLVAITDTFTNVIERSFLNEANSIASLERADIPARAHSLVSFSTNPDDLARWEWSANVRLVEPGVAEADLLHLLRDFGACISIPQVYGKDFLDRNPTLLDDLWKFDNELFPLLIIGVPTWLPLKVIKDGLAARARIHDSIRGIHERTDQYLKGEPVDFGADVSDVSEVIKMRSKKYDDLNMSFKHRGQMDTAFFWAQNGNTQPLVFWFILFIFSTPGLVDELRQEIAPYMSISDSKPAKITSMDLRGLYRKCPLLKSCLYETYRMANEPTSIRYLGQSVTVPDGEYKHELKKGSWISVAYAYDNKSPSLYANPHKFVPDRFLETDPESGKRTARYGTLKPWGIGHGMCKGRTFAELEIIGIGATVMSLWDIKPLGKEWEVPAMRPGTGANSPVNDIRVRISRRV